jgi:uncharacterized membrane protein YheB (UPF0754 family)
LGSRRCYPPAVDPRILAIPLISGLIGWGTNSLAIRMLFAPLHRRGVGLLGWQGVLPAHAERMARLCVTMMTTRLINIRTAFSRVSPDQIALILGPTLEKYAEEIAEQVLSERYPRLWESLPERVRRKVRGRLRERIPEVVKSLMTEIGDDLERYLDVEEIVVQAFVQDRALVNELFLNCGRSEFRFIVWSGLFFGGLFGMVQMVIWFFIQPGWFLPLTGLIVGWATNWIALKMVFRPQEPRGKGPFRWQGLFHRRQAEVSLAYAEFFSTRVLHPEALIGAIIRGPASDRIVQLIQRSVAQAVDQASGPARPLIQLAVGTEEWKALKLAVSARIVTLIPTELSRVHDYAEQALDLQESLRGRLVGLPPDEFEQVLRPVFQEEEGTLITVGALLGLCAGVLQWAMVTAV